MLTARNETIVVMGATGLQGSAVTRHLLADGWRVRAVTRDPESEKAKQLSTLGAEVVEGNMDDPASLLPIFKDAYGVFSVQNPVISGIEGEIRQGKNVADVARQTDIQHVVYSSAGTGKKVTGIPSWESKVVIADYMKSLGMPLTVLYPTAFMELMTEKKFFPAVSTWHVMPKLMGSSTKAVWLSADDLGFIAAQAFSDPGQFIGKELVLASDVKSIDECRTIYRQVMGKNPSRMPMPVWMFERYGFIGKDCSIMWRWLRANAVETDTDGTLMIHPNALSVRSWLERKKSAVT